jgi:hypothetical protein
MSDNITLLSNESQPRNDSYSRIVLKVFGEPNSLAAQKDGLNLVFPGYYGTLDMGQRFAKNQILTPDFVGAFLNSERINPERRKVLSGIISRIVENTEKKLKPIKNPFFTDSSIVAPLGEDVDAELRKVGYFRKKDLPKNEKNGTQSGTLSKPATSVPVAETPVAAIPPPVVPPPVVPPPVTAPAETVPPAVTVSPAPKPVAKPTAKDLSYFTAPSRKPVVSLPFKTEILIGGNVPKGVTAVYINNYQLKGYAAGETRFTYRARTDLGNLKK